MLIETMGRAWRKSIVWVGLAIAALSLMAAALRPWANAVMVVRVTISADGLRPREVYGAASVFSEGDSLDSPMLVDVNLAPWAGKLVRFDVEGRVRRRLMPGSSTGFVACEAELAAPGGPKPLEFVSWQQGREIGAHTEPLGPLAMREDGERDRFAFAMRGSLWHCLKVPAKARLRLRFKPVMAETVSSPTPYVASAAGRRAAGRVPASNPGHRPDVFLYVIDALRADHLGCYGYGRPTSPAIDAFTAQATRYKNAQTAATWTRPSVSTILTGLYPNVHGAMHWSEGLPDWPVLLPEMLRGAGYATQGFVANPNLALPFGMKQGYDRYFANLAPAEWANQMLAGGLSGEPLTTPVFYYIHTMEPHDPYLPSPEDFRRFDRGYRGRYDGTSKSLESLRVPRPELNHADVEHLIDLYDAEIRRADRGFAGFVRALKQAGRYENSLIILTADHGEAFMEHDAFSHAWNLSCENAHVPLIIRYPGGRYAGVEVDQTVSLVDIVPTVLAQVGLSPRLPYALAGSDLARYALSPGSAPSPVFMEVSRWETNDVDLVGVIDEDGFKRVMDVSVPPHETATRSSLGLWDTRADPEEKVDLSRKLPVRAAYDEQLLAQWLLDQRRSRMPFASSPPPRVNLDRALKKELHALGYLGYRPATSGRGR